MYLVHVTYGCDTRIYECKNLTLANECATFAKRLGFKARIYKKKKG